MRLLTSITLLLLVATLSFQAKAAGMGDIKVLSGLSQPLRAEIPIKLNHPGERDSLTVSLAVDQGFSTNDLVASPADLELTLSQTRNGEPVVLVSTQAPVVEPAFSIFILLTTQDSRILREYTLLLDWPTQTSEPVQTEPVSEQLASHNHATETMLSPVTSESNASFNGEEPRPKIYVPSKSETLWSIADKLRPNEQVSVHVMVKAIADSNPDAFNLGNINSLKNGFVLQVPDDEVVKTIQHQDAVNFVNGQNAAWQDRRNTTNNTQAALVEQQTDVQATAPNEQTKLSEVNELEKQALLKRIASLESQLTTMESMLLEVNRDLAEAQSKNELENTQLGVTETPPTNPQPVFSDEPEVKAEPGESPASENVSETQPSVTASDVTPATKQAQPQPQPQSSPHAEEDTLLGIPMSADKIIKLLSDNNSIIAMVAGVLLIIGAFLTYRAKRQAEAMATNAVITVPTTAEDQGPLEESLSVVESMGVEDDSEDEALDRIVEIDVYLAYGRYSEAEALANEGIAEEPGRVDYYLKLFEAYKATGNQTSFESEAESFFSAMATEHPEAWEQVIVMGKELCPNHPLFMDLDNNENVHDESLDNSIDDMDAFMQDGDTSESDTGLDKSPDASAETEDQSRESMTEATEEPLDEEVHELSNEFISEEVSTDIETNEIISEEDSLVVAEVAEELEEQQEKIEQSQAGNASSESSIDAEDSLELSLDEGEADATSSMTDDELIESAAAEFIDNDLNTLIDDESFDKDPMAELNDTVAALEEIENQGEAYPQNSETDQEAVETKLDLVRAYIEMDDQEEARRILDEILNEGSEEQKQQAQDLKQQIA